MTTDPFGPQPKGARVLIGRNLSVMNHKHFSWLTHGWWRCGYDQGYEAGLEAARKVLR